MQYEYASLSTFGRQNYAWEAQRPINGSPGIFRADLELHLITAARSDARFSTDRHRDCG